MPSSTKHSTVKDDDSSVWAMCWLVQTTNLCPQLGWHSCCWGGARPGWGAKQSCSGPGRERESKTQRTQMTACRAREGPLSPKA